MDDANITTAIPAAEQALQQLRALPEEQQLVKALDLLSTAEAAAAPELRNRTDIDDRYKWNLNDIFPDWDAWQRAYTELVRMSEERVS